MTKGSRIGYGRYGAGESIDEDIIVDKVRIVLEGELSVSFDGETVPAGPGEMVHMLWGNSVTISVHDKGAVIAYVSYPHWQQPALMPAATDIRAYRDLRR